MFSPSSGVAHGSKLGPTLLAKLHRIEGKGDPLNADGRGRCRVPKKAIQKREREEKEKEKRKIFGKGKKVIRSPDINKVGVVQEEGKAREKEEEEKEMDEINQTSDGENGGKYERIQKRDERNEGRNGRKRKGMGERKGRTNGKNRKTGKHSGEGGDVETEEQHHNKRVESAELQKELKKMMEEKLSVRAEFKRVTVVNKERENEMVVLEMENWEEKKKVMDE
ncbi:hypothetical protein RI129_011278 [Pyrocoelia pectoralis]|uniref:Uncharacterized protein n=1 Tax=Pyrocoelia pectoralis TaxID=417401 RepID=A0AAN7V3R5_9COLE